MTLAEADVEDGEHAGDNATGDDDQRCKRDPPIARFESRRVSKAKLADQTGKRRICATDVDVHHHDHHRDDRPDERLEQVGTQSADVTDVVADVVGDRRRVAGIVFVDVHLDLTDHVGRHIRSLRVDASADAVKQGDKRCPHRVRADDQRTANEVDAERLNAEQISRFDLQRGRLEPLLEQQDDDDQPDQRQPGHGEPHDAAARERHVERILE